MDYREAVRELERLSGETLNDPDGIQEALESLLFDLKNFFRTRLAVRKLFEPKLKQLQNLMEIEQVLFEDEKKIGDAKGYHFSDLNLEACFLKYHQIRNETWSRMMAARGAAEIHDEAIRLLELQICYAEAWFCPENKDVGGVIISREPDTMQLLQQIRLYAERGGTSFQQLCLGEKQAPEELVLEQKRLSLLLTKYR
ncbi:MAG: hypothetical protein EP338_01120 [Bacteroidetes bacterium]|nr:MAG: hypothetical protein EP338_01120 [Bacteroidota bacterium]